MGFCFCLASGGELSLRKDIESKIAWWGFFCFFFFLVYGRNVEAEYIWGVCSEE